MKVMRPKTCVACAILATLSGWAHAAEACSCNGIARRLEAAEAAGRGEEVDPSEMDGSAEVLSDAWEIVFSGRAVESRSGGPGSPDTPAAGSGSAVRWVRFDVADSWRGVSDDAVWVRTAWEGTVCGYDFVVGGEYLVFASPGRRVSTCSPTEALEKAETERGWLGVPERRAEK